MTISDEIESDIAAFYDQQKKKALLFIKKQREILALSEVFPTLDAFELAHCMEQGILTRAAMIEEAASPKAQHFCMHCLIIFKKELGSCTVH